MTFRDCRGFPTTFRGKYGFGMACTAVFVCFVAIVIVWWPTNEEKDSFRILNVQPPALGHWLTDETELKAVRAEVLMMEANVEALPKGTYTAEAHFANMKRLLDIEKSLLPIVGGVATSQMIAPPYSSITKTALSWETGSLTRDLPITINNVTRTIVHKFGETGWEIGADYAAMVQKAGLSERSARPVVETDWNAASFLAWIIQTHIQSMIVVFFFFLLRAEIIGRASLRQMLGQPFKTVFWMFCWPVGIFRYPTNDVVVLLRLVQQQLAMAFSAMFALAVPSFAHAQSGNGERTEDTSHTLVLEDASNDKPKNSFGLAFEAVNKYHGMGVGEIFEPSPAPRIMGRYTRSTGIGDFYVDSWNSAGKGFNAETDLGVGYARSGWDISYAQFFIRGGDIGQLSLSKTIALWRRLPVTLNLLQYFGTSSTSPPTGTVFKLSTSLAHSLGKGFGLSHRVAASIDNNPFGLGEGTTALGFYTAEVGYKNAYAAWNASVPIAGRGNTTRGFRQSIAGGYRHAFAW